MNNIFYTSDWHLYHKNIKEFCPHSRKGDTPEQMSEMILENIFKQTRPGDIIYNLGDVSFGTAEQTTTALTKINKMRIVHHLILGNHDHRIKKDNNIGQLFDSVDNLKTINVNKQAVVLCHFPMRSWDRMHHGSFMLHGHTHGSLSTPGRIMDVGIDTRPCGDMTLWSHEEIVKILSTQQPGWHH